MGLMDLFKKKSSGDVAKDRLKLLLVTVPHSNRKCGGVGDG